MIALCKLHSWQACELENMKQRNCFYISCCHEGDVTTNIAATKLRYKRRLKKQELAMRKRIIFKNFVDKEIYKQQMSVPALIIRIRCYLNIPFLKDIFHISPIDAYIIN
jgi:hypothetical protein